MHYTSYFKPQQKVFLKTVSDDEPPRSELFATSLVRCSDTFFDLALPDSSVDDAELPFEPGANFFLLSDSFGMGIQLTGHFEERLGRTVIRVTLHGDMEVFSRRKHLRVDVTTGIYCKRGAGTLRSYREQWNAAVKAQGKGAVTPENISPVVQEINLSAGGICVPLAPPVAIAELCLMLLAIDDGNPPIWTLCEVVWANGADAPAKPAGLRFVEIVKTDQKRINGFVLRELQRQGHDVQMFQSRQEMFEQMQF